jgi:hypothetical protein
VNDLVQSFAPIPTRFKGCHFRSRLEARWAVFFDHMQIAWEYEPEGFTLPDGTMYLPEFLLPELTDVQNHSPVWVEVKKPGGDIRKTVEFCRALWQEFVHTDALDCTRVLILDGSPSRLPLDGFNLWGNATCGGTHRAFDEKYLTTHPHPFRFLSFYEEEFNSTSAINKVSVAVNAARSARFEHGQSGAT